jgi:hypothetical protein
MCRRAARHGRPARPGRRGAQHHWEALTMGRIIVYAIGTFLALHLLFYVLLPMVK